MVQIDPNTKADKVEGAVVKGEAQWMTMLEPQSAKKIFQTFLHTPRSP